VRNDRFRGSLLEKIPSDVDGIGLLDERSFDETSDEESSVLFR